MYLYVGVVHLHFRYVTVRCAVQLVAHRCDYLVARSRVVNFSSDRLYAGILPM